MRDESYERQVHDSLRQQGLVPAGEDMHYTACSVGYRTKMREALKEFGDENPVDLKSRIRQLEREFSDEEDARMKAENDRSDARREADDLADKLLAANLRIEELEKAAE